LLWPDTLRASGELTFAQLPIHHWRYLLSNQRSVQKSHYFQQFVRPRIRNCLDSGSAIGKILQKNVEVAKSEAIRPPNYRWHFGQ
jgi:hypothetical protein